ncbi:PAC2 family protein [Corynebacterium bovis]|uniref:Proteasome protein n=1 Tax=Corynebacterium bovis TaxID=36808 RepID=A0A426Q7D6_9CORY|nr:PAC2 family protein [Corynebacterium bovis]RRO93268.1 proteasome protein [Corynebacterium bovis]RRO97129.1 proteasome protein [Corynebacterium bovis]RRO98255.1 proteasome protein [Corynebacterium bovis]RRQ01137.1 proteasome protein [Corynebacterium bovis]RRQ04950.1 proteasome protein [Corynebacterium bovis]
MSENNRMYELEYPAPIGRQANGDGVTLIVALQGYADAGQAVQQSGVHLLQALEHSPVATFDVDELIDYRSRRPGVTIDHDRLAHHEELSLSLHALRDTEDAPFLLLTGPEPDLRWNAFAAAVADLAARTTVTKVVSLYSAPMTVPHTRPLVVSAHSSNPELVTGLQTWESRLIVPGSAALEIELAVSRRDIDAVGLTAHVPHYISASDYPEATYGLLRATETVSGLHLPLRALEADMERIREQLTEQVEDSHEIAAVVSALEKQYDDEAARIRRRRENTLLGPGEHIPSGDELGAEFERFLADVADRGTGDDDGAEPSTGGVSDADGPGAGPSDADRDDDTPSDGGRPGDRRDASDDDPGETGPDGTE